MKVLSVVGNRPQFIKSAPLSVALRDAAIDEIVLHTGQHYDRGLSDVFFEELGLEEPRYRLDLHTADPSAMQPRIGETHGAYWWCGLSLIIAGLCLVIVRRAAKATLSDDDDDSREKRA